MAFNENVNLNTGIIVGGAQTWTIAAGKTLTVNANINTHISPLTINCIGDTVVNGAIRDVHGDSMWTGLLTDSSGSVTKSGTAPLPFPATIPIPAIPRLQPARSGWAPPRPA